MDGRYIVGIDGSRPSEAALAWAIREAGRADAELILAHVDETEAGLMGHDFADASRRDGAVLVAETADRVTREHPGLRVGTRLLEGSTSWALAHAAEGDDLIVVGTHKTGFLHGRVLGSRSVQIAVLAACSVAVVPDVDLRFRTGVVAGIDRVDTAAEVARAAAVQALARGCELLLLTASTPPVLRSAADETLAAALTAARVAAPRLTIRTRSTHRPAAEALLDASRDKALLVLGPGSQDPLRSPVGSVLHDVLLNLNAPVVVAQSMAHRAVAAN